MWTPLAQALTGDQDYWGDGLSLDDGASVLRGMVGRVVLSTLLLGPSEWKVLFLGLFRVLHSFPVFSPGSLQTLPL